MFMRWQEFHIYELLLFLPVLDAQGMYTWVFPLMCHYLNTFWDSFLQDVGNTVIFAPCNQILSSFKFISVRIRIDRRRPYKIYPYRALVVLADFP